MNRLTRNAFLIQIQSKTGFEFEDFIDELYLLKHGAKDYIPIRRVKDGGNDGTIKSEKKVLACYAPAKYNKSDFKAKVNGTSRKRGDFEKYVENWQDTYPYWEMTVNHEIAPEQLILINGLKGNASIIGLSQIISIIENLPQNKIRKLAEHLDLSEYIKKDYVKEILNDLLSSPSNIERPIKYKAPLYIEDKIKINFEEEHIDGISSEFNLLFSDFAIIVDILKGYNDNEIKTIRWRIIEDYNNLSGTFKTRLKNLTNQYTKLYGNIEDDEYRKSVRAILLYTFEQCFIGKKSEKES